MPAKKKPKVISSYVRNLLLGEIVTRYTSKISVKELARTSGLSTSTIHKVETGGHVFAPRLDTFMRISDATGASASKILREYELAARIAAAASLHPAKDSFGEEINNRIARWACNVAEEIAGKDRRS